MAIMGRSRCLHCLGLTRASLQPTFGLPDRSVAAGRNSQYGCGGQDRGQHDNIENAVLAFHFVGLSLCPAISL